MRLDSRRSDRAGGDLLAVLPKAYLPRGRHWFTLAELFQSSASRFEHIAALVFAHSLMLLLAAILYAVGIRVGRYGGLIWPGAY